MEEAAVRSAEEEAARILAGLDGIVDTDLKKMGLSPRERRATWDRVDGRIRKAMPKGALADLAAGRIPERGFGIGSDTGTGKTMALACVLRRYVEARRRAFAERLPRFAREHPSGHLELELSVAWLSWPDTVTWLRAHAVDDAAEARLYDAERAHLLVLDDLGRERIKGSYVEDWAASQLDRIISHRYREMLPTIWTSNLREETLAGIYGAAILSRLTEEAPLVWIEGLPSLRLER